MQLFPRDAWSALGDMSKEEAMIAYVEEMKKVSLLMSRKDLLEQMFQKEIREREEVLADYYCQSSKCVIPYVNCYISVLYCLAHGEKKTT